MNDVMERLTTTIENLNAANEAYREEFQSSFAQLQRSINSLMDALAESDVKEK